ncbi:nickel-type superoxide dismutase maturation protease [Sinobacterium caligoides]|uniref:Nickel-type superoxide dismutase maturation protease n=1 Tax=Sinobacterium caligoides TaxID=933926 RepID=A0A3N2DZT2_9GAMM|nr:nickel-type superoxide dismutase maturation protease [Sinobacterium caligoides]ROS05383.1 nickel-type superoxide dismutase maturation protease [Sinobacterium caligoides]
MSKIKLYKVTGESMLPTFRSGDYVLALKRRRIALDIGDVVVVQHPRFGTIIKRLTGITDGSTLLIAGDNRLASTPQPTLGSITPEQVIGKVIFHIAGQKTSVTHH